MAFDRFSIGTVTGSPCTCSGGTITDCSTCATMPNMLFVTDILGTYPAPWVDTGGGGSYLTGALCAASQSPVSDCSSGVPVCHTGSQSGDPLYWYEIECHSSGNMEIIRFIGDLPCTGFVPRSQYIPCACFGGAIDPTYQLDIAQAVIAVTCGSISWSGTLTPTGPFDLSDPVGGTTSFTQ